MAVKLFANYAKRLGLPGFSSHQFSVSVEIELRDIAEAPAESEKLYMLLQQNVDQQMQETGFVPPITYGLKPGEVRADIPANGNGTQTYGHPSNGHPSNGTGNGNGHQSNGNGSGHQRNGEVWNCTEGQRGLILRVINEHRLNRQDVEDQAHQLFGVGLQQMDKMQASQVIEELLEKVGKKPAGQRRWSRQPART